MFLSTRAICGCVWWKTLRVLKKRNITFKIFLNSTWHLSYHFSLRRNKILNSTKTAYSRLAPKNLQTFHRCTPRFLYIKWFNYCSSVNNYFCLIFLSKRLKNPRRRQWHLGSAVSTIRFSLSQEQKLWEKRSPVYSIRMRYCRIKQAICTFHFCWKHCTSRVLIFHINIISFKYFVLIRCVSECFFFNCC